MTGSEKALAGSQDLVADRTEVLLLTDRSINFSIT